MYSAPEEEMTGGIKKIPNNDDGDIRLFSSSLSQIIEWWWKVFIKFHLIWFWSYAADKIHLPYQRSYKSLMYETRSCCKSLPKSFTLDLFSWCLLKRKICLYNFHYLFFFFFFFFFLTCWKYLMFWETRIQSQVESYQRLKKMVLDATLRSTQHYKVRIGKCQWCRKWTQPHEFKSWMRLIAFHIALIPLGKVWIQLFSLQLWVSSRAD